MLELIVEWYFLDDQAHRQRSSTYEVQVICWRAWLSKRIILLCYQMVAIQIDLLLSTRSLLAMISSFPWWHRTRTVLASRPFYLSGLDCTGSETSLLSCPYTNPPGYPCSSKRGVRVTCSSPEEDEEGTPEEEEGEYALRWCGGGSWLRL